MNYDLFFDWIEKLFYGLSTAGAWLTTPLPYINIAPLWLLTVGGLLAFMTVALVKWFVS